MGPHVLLSQLRALKRRIVSWRACYLKLPQDPPLSATLSNSLLSVSLSISSMVNRMIVALRTSADDAAELEEEAQELARKVMALKAGKIVTSGFFIGMVTKATAGEWRDAVADCEPAAEGARDVIDASAWIKWNAMMGRRDGVFGSFWPR
jgi:hypothetical protein